MAQTTSTTDGTTPSGLAPGSPAGSYALSGFDNVNLYNGNLNLVLPLLSVGGRGSAGYQMTLALSSKSWRVQKIYVPASDAYKFKPTQSNWGISAGLGPGMLAGRQMGVDYGPCSGGSNDPLKSMTTLTFAEPDGTEHELRDMNTNGQPLPATGAGCFTGASRGTVFATHDGSSMTFVSDVAIIDKVVRTAQTIYPDGYLFFRDGTCYRIDDGRVSWIRDRNGNRTSFAYVQNPMTITDPLNREITVTSTGPLQSEINYKGFAGAPRTIRINYTALSNALRTGYAIQTYGQLFPELYISAPIDASVSLTNNPTVVSSLTLPDGRQYQFLYNSYGEVARVILPTGGAIEYDMTLGSGVVSHGPTDQHQIYRRVAERRVYPDGSSGSTFESRTTFIANTNSPFDPKPWYTNVKVEQFDQIGILLTRQKHYFNGSGVASLFKFFTNVPSSEFYPAWGDGKEYQTEALALDTSGNALRRTVNVWQQASSVGWWTGPPEGSPANDPRVTQTDTILRATQ